MISLTIYVDVVLMENLIMNYIILLATGIIIKKKINHTRLIISSLLGAFYSIISYMSILDIYSSLILKIVLSIVLVYIAFNPQNMKKMWKEVVIFYLISFVFGGVAFSLIYIIKPQNILMRNGLFLGTYHFKNVFLGAIVGFFIIMLAFKIVKSKISSKDMFCEIEIIINGKTVRSKAMIDTGNFLKEPITNTPVIVVEHTLLYNCLPKEILNNLNEILGGDFEKVPEKIKEEYTSKLKLIPFSSLGKQNGMLIGIKPDYIKINQDEKEIKKENVIMGIYNNSLTKRGEYRVLIGLDLIE